MLFSLVPYCLPCYGLCLGMHIPELCSGKQAYSTGNATTSVPTWVKYADAVIPAFAGMTN